MPSRGSILLALSVLALGGCAGPGAAMLAADVVSAAVKASVEYSERTRPSPEETLARFKLDLLRERAAEGNRDAQYALALELQSASDAEAERWMCRAANRGHARAQLNLGHWYNEDRTREDLWPYIRLRPDDREAFVWYSLASTNGDVFAPHFRRRLIDGALNPDALAEAENRLARWEPTGCGYVSTAGAAQPPPEQVR